MKPEAALERKATQMAKKMGIYTRKFTSPGHRGVPDRVFAYHGILIFIEFKAPNKNPSPLQKREINELLRQNILATWADDTILLTFVFKSMVAMEVEDLILFCQKRYDFLD